MDEIKNKDVMHQIKKMVETLHNDDPSQAKIIQNLLQEVVNEFNSGRTRNIEKKLYDMIDGETFESNPKPN